MTDLLTNIPFTKLGWAMLQLAWISTLYIGGMALVWKILRKFSAKLKYNIGLGALLALPFISGLLFVEHSGILPPIGLADWDGSTSGQTTREPFIEGLPQITGLELAPSLYYWLGIIWTAAVCLLITYHLISLAAVHIKCQNKSAISNKKIESHLNELAGELNINTNFKIKATDFREGPAVTGIVRPILLIPDTLTEHYNDDELKGLLLHELIHIKRRDNLFAFLQHLICSLFFFQPLILWISREINREREHLCDQAVTGITNDSHTYGNTLVKLKLQTQAAMAYSVNMAEKNIVQRIKRLADINQHTQNLSQKFSRYSIAFLITAVTLFCTLWNAYHLHHSHNSELQPAEESQELVITKR